MFLAILIDKRRLKLIFGLAIVTALLLLTPLLNLPDRLATVVGQGERLVPIYYVDTNEKKVAFSFDASWGAERTEKILQILKENEIKTTFFLTGFWVEAYPHYVKLIAEEGHEIGNHTLTHPHLNSLTKEEIKAELKNVEEMIQQVSGQKTTLFRPPFGEYNNQVIEAASELGYKTIQWSIDSLDWQNLSREEIIERVTSRAHKGAIILFHNNGLHTADALPEIIAYYRKHGYEILPVSQLIYHEDYYIDPNSGAQIKKPRR
ncbi:MAG: polysaccharide deacetylase family protein [Firmicutes bacterium]|nr:polysaccharide deacetylase family protein [Bacillota bacterium]HPU01020.1 polysaccharide deacetylase family protein [Bacillota bacterium]